MNQPLRIVADENIPLAEAFFAELGELTRLPGRDLSAAAVREADVLLVRSVTQVNQALLQGSKVRFVGTCTIGTDHLDLPWLAEAGIQVASAPGCNARAVVDYVLGALLHLAELSGETLEDKVIGIVGAGRVGGALHKVLKALGLEVRVCDPPRAAEEEGEFYSLQALIAEADVLCLHTPLIHEGEHPTWHLLDEARIATLKPGQWLINAGRGAVVDNQALLARLQAHDDLWVALDVWETEPNVEAELARRVHLATPHIAGYSLDGRLRGTEMIYQALCTALQTEAKQSLANVIPEHWLKGLRVTSKAEPAELLALISRSVYDPRRDDAAFRRHLRLPAHERPAAFDALRKHYPVRREIPGLKLFTRQSSAELNQLSKALGCSVDTL
ncbi:4-phosphoerythronate dehydrogenase PdxB [Atopomonas sediminilitoris]|uniref:4-phosphoerythronate dehydrogenase PdxB n=1 Tax=Atopomonas sediminilitoris TaxID=2919919 RepID=UPI001F4DBA8B|nr:4-phosphoerythronate dehydrogenase PdxB [Atopomonas sediminilitoris]MCJ8169166.1 4-phosphoerythronate dehydrogenase PdxB [Atopomonas sediminilitoris]